MSVLTAGHCCLGSDIVSLKLSAYDLKADTPEEGVLDFDVVDDELPEDFPDPPTVYDSHWDVCILDLREHVSTIKPAPIGKALHVNFYGTHNLYLKLRTGQSVGPVCVMLSSIARTLRSNSGNFICCAVCRCCLAISFKPNALLVAYVLKMPEVNYPAHTHGHVCACIV